MDLGIKGKIAVVTACSSGLGNAVAHALAAEGAKLVLFARSEDVLRKTAADIESRHHVQALAVAGDMRSEADVKRMVAAMQEKFGAPDILVLSTGRPPIPMREVLDETDAARWEEAYRVQLWGAVLVTRNIVPLMLPRGWGRVISITSATVKQPMIKHGLSTVFRAGVTAYMKHLANEVAARGITVNTVCPASIATANLTSSYDMTERAKRIPLRRVGRPEELAATVTFLASEQAGFITGASLHVDGGMVASLC